MMRWFSVAIFSAFAASSATAAPSSPMAYVPMNALRLKIADAKTRTPQAFSAVASIRARVLAVRATRDRRAAVARSFRALGAEGLYPLLALVDDDLAGLDPTDREVLLVGALDAIGKLRDKRSVPVLSHILDSSTERPGIVRAAAEALGMLCGDEERTELESAARAGQRWEREAISGLRACRKEPAVRFLADRLTKHPSPDVAREIAESLGYLGSSWAWETFGAARAAEGDAVRALAVRALVEALPSYDATVREAIEIALSMIDHPSTAVSMPRVR